MSIQNDIVTYARQHGIDPAYALAVAERESSFRPNAHASKTIYGLFQMSGAERAKYGVPVTQDVGTQVRGFSDYTNNLKADMAKRLGREPTPSETYLGHYWGPGRAAGVIKGRYSGLTAKDVFTPYELSVNPNLKPNKPVEDLADGIIKDMDRRYSKYGGEGGTSTSQPTTNTVDLTKYGMGDAEDEHPSLDNDTVKTAMSPNDLSSKDAPTALAGLTDQKPATDATTVADAGQVVPPHHYMQQQTAPAAPMPNLAPATINPAPLATQTPDLTTPAPAAASPEVGNAITSLASNDGDKGDLSDISSLLSGIGNTMSRDKRPAAPALRNPDQDVIENALLARQVQAQTIPGVSLIPGQQAQGSPMLPASGQPGFQLDPSMFGVQQG